MTHYLVFKQDGPGLLFQGIGEAEANSCRAAIQGVLAVEDPFTEKGEDTGTFVAVPARSFQPVEVKPETKLKFSVSGSS